MGYREYFVKVKKRKVNPLRKMSKEQLITWCEENGVEVEKDRDYTYVSIHDIFRALGAKEVFGFGKYYENSEEVTKLGKPLFKDKECEDMFYDYNAHIVGKEAVACAIEWQRQQILKYFKTLALDDEEYKKVNPFGAANKTERLEREVKQKIQEWSCEFFTPYNMDNEDKETLVNSWLYEYTIFDLVRIYKDTNWNTECLIFYGY